MKMNHAVAVASVLTLITHVSADAGTITFDDLSPGGTGSYMAIPNGYGGLQWSGFGVINAQGLTPPSGYNTGLVSGNNDAFNFDPYDRTATISSAAGFNLDSAYLTSTFNDGMQVEVQGYIGSTLAYDHTYTLQTEGPSLVEFNYQDITEAKFIPKNEVEIFVMDNLTVDPVPESNQYAELLAGAGLVGFGLFGKKLRPNARQS